MRAKAEMDNQLLEAVAKGIKVDIPKLMVDDQIDYQIQQMSYQLMYQGMKLDDYLNIWVRRCRICGTITRKVRRSRYVCA